MPYFSSEQGTALLALERPLLRMNHSHVPVAVRAVHEQSRLSELEACVALGTYLRRKRLGHCGHAYGRSPPPLAMACVGPSDGVGVGVAGPGDGANVAAPGADQRMPPACAPRRCVFSSNCVWKRWPQAAHQYFFSTCCLPSPAGAHVADAAPRAAAATGGTGGARGRRSTVGASAGAIDGGMAVTVGGQQRMGAAACIEVHPKRGWVCFSPNCCQGARRHACQL